MGYRFLCAPLCACPGRRFGLRSAVFSRARRSDFIDARHQRLYGPQRATRAPIAAVDTPSETRILLFHLGLQFIFNYDTPGRPPSSAGSSGPRWLPLASREPRSLPAHFVSVRPDRRQPDVSRVDFSAYRVVL